MTPSEIIQNLTNKFSQRIVESNSEILEPFIRIAPQDIPEVIGYLKSESTLKMEYLNLISGVDWLKENKMEVVYHLSSMTHHHKIVIKTYVDRNEPKVPSIVSLYGGANWHEREVYDLMGIKFEGHPDLRRILLPDDWMGHPLRKDYQFPEEYHGIKWA